MKSITNRLEKLESCLKPEVKEKEIIAEEWISYFEHKRDDPQSPILSSFYGELIKALDGRDLWETYSNDMAVKGIFDYITSLERCIDRKIHTSSWDQIKEGVSKFIGILKNNYSIGYYHDCAECGAEIPITPGEEGVIINAKPAVKHFETCPFCGGQTGYAAYYYNQKKVRGYEKYNQPN